VEICHLIKFIRDFTQTESDRNRTWVSKIWH